jgi:RecB family endonuclease NucS
VRELSRDVSVDNGEEGIEVDLLVVDTTQAVAIEVKSKLAQRDVDEHLERLGKFKRLLPRYQNIQLLGAVAAMVAPSEVARYAYRQGLFVITQSGEDLVILNDAKFQPKAW